MKTVNIAGKDNLAATFSSLLLCIVFSHPLWCEAQQTGLRQKPIAPPRQFAVPTAPKQGAIQTGAQAPAPPVTGDITRPSAAPASAQRQLPPAKTNSVVFTDQMGGKVFSSGTEDIRARILPQFKGPPPPGQRLWTEAHTTIDNSGIYLVSPGPERFIGYNTPGNVTVNLGKLPEGEIIFAIKTYDGFTFQTGGADRNPDNLVHAFTRTFALGPVEVWFEDAAGPFHTGRSDRDMDDIAIQLTGGVRGSGKWAELQRAVDEQSARKQVAEKSGVRNAPETAKP